MVKWLAIGMVAMAFAAISVIGSVPELASRRQEASAVAQVSAVFASDEVEGTRLISRAVRGCLKERAGGRVPEAVTAFFNRSVLYLASHPDTEALDFAEGYAASVQRESAAMRDSLAGLDDRERGHLQLILSDFSENPAILMACVARNVAPPREG